MPEKKPLPIDPLLPEIIEGLRSSPNLVLQASPGSGKTTRVPPALLDSDLFSPRQEIWVLVPRRLAARTAAFRVAEERNEKVGESVGYQFRFEKALGPLTRLKFLTEGMLFRLLLHSPRLPSVGLVVLDEFHERHLHTDTALSYLRWLQASHRPDLKLLVMSATLETKTLSGFLGNCPILTLESRAYPLELSHLPAPPSQAAEILIKKAVGDILWAGPNPGDILVFLPGMAEIRRSEDLLCEAFPGRLEILPLHGELPRESQNKVFLKSNRPKVILATNVAETSITIDGVTTVIDGGLHRRASYSWWSGVPALKTRPISKASATQRAGRAGRTGPGKVLRLYTQADFEGRPAFDLPEILRSDLSQTLLELKALGVHPSQGFSWFDPPPHASLQAAVELLFRLGATETADLDAPLTPLGFKLAELPIHPRLSRMLIEAEARKVLPEATLLAALIAEDGLEGLDALHVLESYRPTDFVEKTRHQLLRYFGEKTARGKTTLFSGTRNSLALSLLSGFPDRVAQKRDHPQTPLKGGIRGTPHELVFAAGGSGEAAADPVFAESDTFVVMDVQEKQHQGQARSRVHVKSLCPIRPEWLFDLPQGLLTERSELVWEKDSGRVAQLSKIVYGQLILSESRGRPQDAGAAERMLLREGLGLDLEGSPSRIEVSSLLQAMSRFADPAELEETLARLKLFSRLDPQETLPSLEGEDLVPLILKLFQGFDSFADLKKQDWSRKVLDLLTPKAAARLAQELPTHITLGRGRRVKIRYDFGKAPWIESRLQDFFGMKKGPTLMQGRIPLSLHLLAPNQRPVQVTSDLESFWKNAYPQIRRELKRRYPKHAWPENPLE